MRFRRATVSPLLRFLAAVALPAFIAAQTVCFAHCRLGGAYHNSKARPACHVPRQEDSNHASHEVPFPGPTTTCSTLKSMLAGADAPTVMPPEFHALYPLAPTALVVDAAGVEAHAPFSRRASTRDWVFTPVVCLGPGFRSLAPPFVG